MNGNFVIFFYSFLTARAIPCFLIFVPKYTDEVMKLRVFINNIILCDSYIMHWL